MFNLCSNEKAARDLDHDSPEATLKIHLKKTTSKFRKICRKTDVIWELSIQQVEWFVCLSFIR